jgi:hypothetical protein
MYASVSVLHDFVFACGYPAILVTLTWSVIPPEVVLHDPYQPASGE